jgi:hypothetical protein
MYSKVLASGAFKWPAVNRFGICLKHNKRFNIERRGVGKLGGGQVDIIMAAEGWWGQYLACGEDSSYLPPPLCVDNGSAADCTLEYVILSQKWRMEGGILF